MLSPNSISHTRALLFSCFRTFHFYQINLLKPPEMVHLTSSQLDVKSIWNVLVSLSPQQY